MARLNPLLLVPVRVKCPAARYLASWWRSRLSTPPPVKDLCLLVHLQHGSVIAWYIWSDSYTFHWIHIIGCFYHFISVKALKSAGPSQYPALTPWSGRYAGSGVPRFYGGGLGVAPRYYGGSSSTRLGRYNRLEGKLHQSATWCDLTA